MDQAKADQYAAQLGITSQQIRALQGLPTFEAATSRLDELKKEARSRYRKLVYQYHPDRNPGDSSASETLRELGVVYQHIEKLQLQRRAPQPVVQIHFAQPFVQQVHIRRAPSYSTTTSSGATTTVYNATRVAFVRPV